MLLYNICKVPNDLNTIVVSNGNNTHINNRMGTIGNPWHLRPQIAC